MARIVVTGANRGIGLELVKTLALRHDEVIAACRRRSAALEAQQVEIHEGIDVADIGAVTAFAHKLKDRPIDVLINNAGVYLDRNRLETLDFANLRKEYEINALGPLRLVRALADSLGRGGKVAILSSILGSIDDTQSGGSYGYRMSKAAVNMAGRTLAAELRPKGVAVVLLHPGYVATDMTGHSGTVSPADAARGVIEIIDQLTLDSTGTFWHADGRLLPW